MIDTTGRDERAMADTTPNGQGSSGSGSPGDTLEFLKLLSEASSAEAPATPQPPTDLSPAAPAPHTGVPAAAAGTPAGRMPSIGDGSVPSSAASATPVPDAAATLNSAPTPQRRSSSGGRPVVIKGGPRRVVRADGVQPDTAGAHGQRRFALSSGHAMFVRQRRMKPLTGAIIGLASLALIALIVLVCWFVAQGTVRHDKQLDVVGTSDYDNSLSLTPADDGGYYTVFFVTSTPTDEETIGTLSQVVMYRTDKAVTTQMRITVPANLAVATSSTDSTMISLADALSQKGVSRALQGIDDAFGIRLYETVVCDQQDFDRLSVIMDGSAQPGSVDPDSLLGHVRSSFTLPQIIEFAGKIAAAASTGGFDAPTAPREGTELVNGMSDQFRTAIATGGSVIARDERGNPVGTQYDEAGNPLLDEQGNPQGTIYDEGGQPMVDEQGNVIVYGQQYDEHGNFVGTRYDEHGNPLLDEWGNPLGSQYDEHGEFVRDWRGNVVISA